MIFSKLNEIIQKNKINPDVLLLSDSGWECDPTCMDGIYYSKKSNRIIFTQDYSDYAIQEYNARYNTDDFVYLGDE